jgi:hypothetical protein
VGCCPPSAGGTAGFPHPGYRAAGGIIVSPLPLQPRAKIVAASERNQEVRLSADSTTTSDFVLRFLERKILGVSVEMKSSVDAFVIRTSGKKLF